MWAIQQSNQYIYIWFKRDLVHIKIVVGSNIKINSQSSPIHRFIAKKVAAGSNKTDYTYTISKKYSDLQLLIGGYIQQNRLSSQIVYNIIVCQKSGTKTVYFNSIRSKFKKRHYKCTIYNIIKAIDVRQIESARTQEAIYRKHSYDRKVR